MCTKFVTCDFCTPFYSSYGLFLKNPSIMHLLHPLSKFQVDPMKTTFSQYKIFKYQVSRLVLSLVATFQDKYITSIPRCANYPLWNILKILFIIYFEEYFKSIQLKNNIFHTFTPLFTQKSHLNAHLGFDDIAIFNTTNVISYE